MIKSLEIIKPKRLKDTLNAILLPDNIVLEFGVTRVIIPCTTGYPASIINHKDLFSYNFDAATQITKYELPKLDHTYEECIISVSDKDVMSSFSSAGEDEFFIGKIGVSNKLLLEMYGFTFFASLEVPKLRTESKFEWEVDYPVFYYMFQMFKALSGKKTAKLLWYADKDNLILTNEDKSFYIVCGKDDKGHKYKSKYLLSLKDYFNKSSLGEKQLFKEMVMTLYSEGWPVVKHLGRPLGDCVMQSQPEGFHKLRSDGYTVCLMNIKV